MRSTLALVFVSLLGCGGAPAPQAECPPAPECEAAAPSAGLTDFERQLVDPLLSDVRQGVRPFSDEGVGICEGLKTCDRYLGQSPGDLPEGNYIVRAELRVPNIGEPGTWKVDFRTHCTTTRMVGDREISSENDYNRVYTVRYAGPQRGYRLQPLRTIQSPSMGGARHCTYKLVSMHPDGDHVIEGEWSTPMAEPGVKGAKGRGAKRKGKGAKGKGAKGKKAR